VEEQLRGRAISGPWTEKSVQKTDEPIRSTPGNAEGKGKPLH